MPWEAIGTVVSVVAAIGFAFRLLNKRFDDVDKRFGDVDKRFDDAREDVNKRFGDAREDTDKRFDDVDKRFDDAREDTNRRFDEARDDNREAHAAIGQNIKAVNETLSGLTREVAYLAGRRQGETDAAQKEGREVRRRAARPLRTHPAGHARTP